MLSRGLTEPGLRFMYKAEITMDDVDHEGIHLA
jgi:hypothetical protein